MHHALAVHADVGVLEGRNPFAASLTHGKQGKCVAGELFEDRVVVSP